MQKEQILLTTLKKVKELSSEPKQMKGFAAGMGICWHATHIILNEDWDGKPNENELLAAEKLFDEITASWPKALPGHYTVPDPADPTSIIAARGIFCEADNCWDTEHPVWGSYAVLRHELLDYCIAEASKRFVLAQAEGVSQETLQASLKFLQDTAKAVKHPNGWKPYGLCGMLDVFLFEGEKKGMRKNELCAIEKLVKSVFASWPKATISTRMKQPASYFVPNPDEPFNAVEARNAYWDATESLNTVVTEGRLWDAALSNYAALRHEALAYSLETVQWLIKERENGQD